MGDWRKHAEELFGGEVEKVGSLAEAEQGIAVFAKKADDTGDCVNDRVAASGKDDVQITQLLLAGERAALDFHSGESGEEVIARIFQSAVEEFGAIVLEEKPLRLSLLVAEHMRSPADPEVGVALGGICENGQGAGLQGNGEIVHDFQIRLGEAPVDEAIHQRLDGGDHLRVFRAVEERLYGLTVVVVLGKIHLERILAHGAHILLGGNRDAHRGVTAEMLPIFCCGDDSLVAENHRHGTALELGVEHPGRFASRLEGVAPLRDWLMERALIRHKSIFLMVGGSLVWKLKI